MRKKEKQNAYRLDAVSWGNLRCRCTNDTGTPVDKALQRATQTS